MSAGVEKWLPLIDGIWGRYDPWASLVVFMAGSALMIWRLGALEGKGFEGTILGTLIMPYCSGLSNLVFAYVMGRSSGSGALVLENCLVNNVTNMTLLVGLPAALWTLDLFPGGRGNSRKTSRRKDHRLNRLSLLLTITAMLFFTGVTWALARDGVLDFADGLVLVAVFLFWQVFHVFDVLKTNLQRNRTMSAALVIDLLAILAGGGAVYLGVDRMVAWVSFSGRGILVFDNLGWLSGLLMVLPNALLAFWYARARRADVVYSSQVGDGHICIPMCIGLFALFTPIAVPATFLPGLRLIAAAGVIHFSFLALFGRLPRWAGALLAGVYFFFIYTGFIK
ncbi:MAG: sodium:calcium symporter [Pseudomonadota bacterium]